MSHCPRKRAASAGIDSDAFADVGWGTLIEDRNNAGGLVARTPLIRSVAFTGFK